jgi:hypothetical protein
MGQCGLLSIVYDSSIKNEVVTDGQSSTGRLRHLTSAHSRYRQVLGGLPSFHTMRITADHRIDPGPTLGRPRGAEQFFDRRD